MILFSSSRLLVAFLVFCSINSMAQSMAQTARSQPIKPRLPISRVPADQDDLLIADTLRLATEYEPTKPKKPTSDFLLELEATAPALPDSVITMKAPVSPMPIAPASASTLYQPAVYSQPEQKQTVFHPVVRRDKSPVSRSTPDQAESDLERILNRKKQVN